jgi:DNA-binding transcriptional regulator YdaS (Cro superfamily)
MKRSVNSQKHNGNHLLHIHKLHLGLYARVAGRLGISPSYVSLVANGVRSSEKVHDAIVKEIARIHAAAK